MKKTIFIFLIFILTSCGYESIHSKKNSKSILIKQFQLGGDRGLNRKIISLLNIKKNSNNESGYILILTNNKVVEVVSKDKNGNASIYRTTINVSLSLSDKKKIIKQKSFNSSFTYNNMENKFDLSQYEKNIELNLINIIVSEIDIFLNS
tara:strand:- start:4 stop:453 length:450 start_codon:yes stop_codon:yes gene_type:complete